MKRLLCAVFVTTASLYAQVTCQPPPNTAPAVAINCAPTREFGQPMLFNPIVSIAPNLVEGRELYNPSGIAFDASTNPPHVYIVDTGNNRVLAWNNAANLSQGNTADLVMGQPNLVTTVPGGPGTNQSTGLSAPTGIAVDAGGNVYVADSGNNRILRFKSPFNANGNFVVDLVIGQKTTSSGNSANQGLQSPSATSLYLTYGHSTQSVAAGLALPAGLAVDGQGNLWAADPGNNRVLGFPPSSLKANTSLPAASVVLGESSFTTNALPTTNGIQTNLGFLLNPSGVAVDGQGNLYVADQYARVIQYLASPSIGIGQSGAKVLGIPPTPTQGQVLSYPGVSTLGALNAAGNSLIDSPQGVFILAGANGASVFVCDSPQNRVVRYDTFASTWTIQVPSNSPPQNGVTGQLSSTAGQANQGQLNPSNQTFSYPVAGAINPSNNEMWIVDQFNHRVVAYSSQGGGVYTSASRVVGQTDFIYGSANLIEGREIWVNVNPNAPFGGGVVIDSNSTPPHVYIADTNNNRILGFNDARKVGTDSHNLLTQKADIVIGQADLLHSIINYPNGAAGQPSSTGLFRPVGVAVDSSGNLWVADSGNGRAVRFPAPFSQTPGSLQTATMVLGQPDLNTFNANVSQFSMLQPFGIAIFADGGAPGSGSLAVSDASANRVVVFSRPAGGDFTSGGEASFVVGQPNFTQSGSGSTSSQLNSPRGLAVDSSDRLYVADSNNNRLIVFSKPTGNNPSATLEVPQMSVPQSVTVSFLTGRSWVTSTGNSVLYQLPEFSTLQSTETPTQEIQSSYGPLAVALDPFDNLIVADSANRIIFYFGQLYYKNTASYAAGINSTAGPAPGMLTWVGRYGSAFNFPPSYGTGPAVNMAPPWPLSYNNIQVTVNGLPAPIFRIDPAEVLFEIPNLAPQSGPADFVVSDIISGEIYAAATLTMQQASPGIYTVNAAGTGQVAANVYDSKGNLLYSGGNNSPTNTVSVGGIIGLWLTGAGFVAGLPTDGTAPGNCGGSCTPLGNLTVLIQGQPAQIVGQAISPQFPGAWQVNAIVPVGTTPSTTAPVSIVVELDDYNSNVGGTNGGGGYVGPGADQLLSVANQLITTIYVK